MFRRAIRFSSFLLLATATLDPESSLALAHRRARVAHEPWLWASAQDVTPHGKRELRVLTARVSGPGTDAARALSQRLSSGDAPHVALIQGGALRDAGYAFVAEGQTTQVLSEFPIVASSHRGRAIHARIQVPGLPLPLELFNARIRAAGPEDQGLRDAQDFREFLWETQLTHLPAIFGGDLGFRPDDDSYPFFRWFTRASDAADAFAALDGGILAGRGYRLFHLDGSGPDVYLRPVEAVLSRLSGHEALEVRYEMSW